ncbi:caspase-10 [Crotalus adamanteus]|uniref:Caspase-10 n=1 Tax=Crotalus adamanteus TaxID=8729 RepID=A0AAW1C9W9_CROAD
MPNRGKVSGYRQLLYEIAEELTKDNVKDAAFLLKADLPKKQPIMSALELLTSLEKKDLLQESDLRILEYICQKTAPHLLRKIEIYKQIKVPHQENKETVPSSVCAFNMPVSGNTSLQDIVPPKNHEHLYNEMFGSLEEHIGIVYSLAENQDLKAEPVLNFLGQGLQQTVRKTDTLNQYKMDGQYRGYCLIINNVNFEGNLRKRKGSEKDAMELKRVFTWLGFKVKKYDDQTSTEIGKLLQFWQFSEDWKDSDCLHLTSSIPDEADFLLGMATVDGYLSFRHVHEGTWYIQALCSKLQLLVPRGEDILSILTEVNEEVSKRADAQQERKQMPQPAYTLRKKLIFPVPKEPFAPSEQSSDMQ